jgi:hypothetical protein
MMFRKRLVREMDLSPDIESTDEHIRAMRRGFCLEMHFPELLKQIDDKIIESAKACRDSYKSPALADGGVS